MTGQEPYVSSYVHRIVDAGLADALSYAGAVLIEGPKACGKTETARQLAGSEVLLDVDDAARLAASVHPGIVLSGVRPRLIDEWQIEPRIWDHVRRAVDEAAAPGQFILTGSSVPPDDATRHTGAGRISRLRMRTMSLVESGHSTGEIQLADLLRGGAASAPESGLGLNDVIDRICHGGWPGMQALTTARAMRALRDYLDEIRRTDIVRVDGRARDPERVGRLLRSYARHVATSASAMTIAADAGGSDGELDRNTVRDYLSALERLMVVEEVPAWAPHLRSRSRLRSAPKRHFVDPALAVAALDASPAALLRDLNLTGYLFESLVVRDLRVYAQSNEARVMHYRDNTDLEVDVIVTRDDGSWGAFEVKLGPGQIDAAAGNLRRFVDRVDTSKVGEPSALGVITTFGYGYCRPDGVNVIPIGSLGP